MTKQDITDAVHKSVSHRKLLTVCFFKFCEYMV